MKHFDDLAVVLGAAMGNALRVERTVDRLGQRVATMVSGVTERRLEDRFVQSFSAKNGLVLGRFIGSSHYPVVGGEEDRSVEIRAANRLQAILATVVASPTA